jgi:hypothetical protein
MDLRNTFAEIIFHSCQKEVYVVMDYPNCGDTWDGGDKPTIIGVFHKKEDAEKAMWQHGESRFGGYYTKEDYTLFKVKNEEQIPCITFVKKARKYNPNLQGLSGTTQTWHVMVQTMTSIELLKLYNLPTHHLK